MTDKPKLHKQIVANSNRWFNHLIDEVTFPDGRYIPEHHVLKFHGGSVGIVAVNEANEVLLVRVYRYPFQSYEWEIPAGGIESKESPLEAAKRELFEETGYCSFDEKYVYSFRPMNSITDKVFHVVHCKVTGSPVAETDGEVQSARWVSHEETRKLIENNDISDGLTLVGLLLGYLG